jgi:hypothetical protein
MSIINMGKKNSHSFFFAPLNFHMHKFVLLVPLHFKFISLLIFFFSFKMICQNISKYVFFLKDRYRYLQYSYSNDACKPIINNYKLTHFGCINEDFIWM